MRSLIIISVSLQQFYRKVIGDDTFERVSRARLLRSRTSLSRALLFRITCMCISCNVRLCWSAKRLKGRMCWKGWFWLALCRQYPPSDTTVILSLPLSSSLLRSLPLALYHSALFPSPVPPPPVARWLRLLRSERSHFVHRLFCVWRTMGLHHWQCTTNITGTNRQHHHHRCRWWPRSNWRVLFLDSR